MRIRRPIIFLDFDDVLVLEERAWELFETVDGQHAEPHRVYAEAFASSALENLKRLLQELPDARIVITSSWRKSFGGELMRDVLNRCGANILVERLHERDPHSARLGDRLAEIHAWLAKHRSEVSAWCAIDDAISGASLAVFMRHQPNHPDASRLVLCDPAVGFSERDLERTRGALLTPWHRDE